MKKQQILGVLFLCTLLAGILGVYAQDISYFFYYKFSLPLLLTLGISTVLSWILFIVPPLRIFIGKSKEIQSLRFYKTYLGINSIIGILVCGFSFIVLVAWLG